jgi:GMP synthase-like glutamine amidotransferase
LIAFDCVHDVHENAQFTAETRQQLIESVLRHFDQYHPEVSEEEVNELVDASAYDPERRPHTIAPIPLSTEVPSSETVGLSP